MATLVNLSRSLNFWRGLVATVNRIKSEQSFLLSYLCVAKRIPSHQLLAGRFVKQTAKRKAIPAFSRPSVQKREEEGGIHRRGVCVCVYGENVHDLWTEGSGFYTTSKKLSQPDEKRKFSNWMVGWWLPYSQPTRLKYPRFCFLSANLLSYVFLLHFSSFFPPLVFSFFFPLSFHPSIFQLALLLLPFFPFSFRFIVGAASLLSPFVVAQRVPRSICNSASLLEQRSWRCAQKVAWG